MGSGLEMSVQTLGPHPGVRVPGLSLWCPGLGSGPVACLPVQTCALTGFPPPRLCLHVSIKLTQAAPPPFPT